jgi:hypothetical protein
VTQQQPPQLEHESGIVTYITRIPVLNIALAIGCIAFLAGYLAINTRTAAKGFMVRSLEQEIAALEEQQNNINLEIFSKQSMHNVQRIIDEKGFIPVQNVDVIEKKDGPVAAK